ncbi:hypothetical protein SFRURICE_012955 [Spodoptera frugiperda]|nr:hypothetical protein SFRURICE_012955 [Spodoptera frugiperda]
MVTVTAADLGAANLTPLFKGAAGALLAAGAAGVIFGTVFFFFPLFTTSVHVSVGGVAEGSPASSGWLRGAAWTVPSSTCASAHVLGASGAATWDFFPFPLPLEGFGAWGCPLVDGTVAGAGIATGALSAASGGRMRFSGNSRSSIPARQALMSLDL